MKFYEVGGCVRDMFMDVESKDVDFAVEAESFQEMEKELKLRGFKIFQSNPEFLTIRAQVPPTESPLFKRTKVADFVMCRKDAATGDGRRPDYVEPGTIYDDLARRDFTVNAIAIDTTDNSVLDPYGGALDVKNRVLRFVGNPMDRIKEDGLRVMRGFRFMVTKDFRPLGDTSEALGSPEAADMLLKVSVERIREELDKMFSHDTITSLWLINTLGYNLRSAIFRDGLRLMPTLKGQ